MTDLPDDYSRFIFLSRYAKFLDDEGRRETWEETVSRYMNFMYKQIPTERGRKALLPWKEEIRNSILKCDVMPSMRALMTAGPALERESMCGYNCTYVTIDTLKRFSEILYVLMCGSGVGFSCEKQYIEKLPVIPADLNDDPTLVIRVEDSRIGWAMAYQKLLSFCIDVGSVPSWDLSMLRPSGARLMTMGGRSAGPEPLDKLFKYTVDLIRKCRGRRMTSLEVHCLVCNIASIVVVGGVRRSALISLSDVDDEEMRDAKHGEWYIEHPYLSCSNNSATYNGTPSRAEFDREWKALVESKSGERGIFNRKASRLHSEREGRKSVEGKDYGTNPCSEIILRPQQCCNLTEVVIRPWDDNESIEKKITHATILGTLQSMITDFKFVDDIWRENCREERLLGVSLTGIMDNRLFCDISTEKKRLNLENMLSGLKGISIGVNFATSYYLGINASTAITCVKPSGTVSQLVGCASGIHPSWSEYYIRRVRVDNKDPISKFMRDKGIPWEIDTLNPNNYVFEFPMSRVGSITRHNIDAIGQLELWLVYYKSWCMHKPSLTAYVEDTEESWKRVGDWVYEHFNDMSGVSFLPQDCGSYKQAPYEEITSEEYVRRVREAPREICWKDLQQYESEATDRGGAIVYACSAAGGCEDVDLVSVETTSESTTFDASNSNA